MFSRDEDCESRSISSYMQVVAILHFPGLNPNVVHGALYVTEM